MEKLETVIKNFCKSNTGKTDTDFSLFKSPDNLYKQFGAEHTLNKFKGNILEMLLEELFLGNGYRVKRLGEGGKDGGCDLLVKYSHDNSIRFVLQAKNWNKNIDQYDVKKEHYKFVDNYKEKYNLNNTHFCCVSWRFVKNIKIQLLNLNIKVWDEQDIINKLLGSYHSIHPQAPSILLEPYQDEAFKNILRFWNEDKRCYVEHSTGTGKTYIIVKLTQELLSRTNNNILILSPSSYINDRIFNLLEDHISSKNIARTYKKDKRVYLFTYQYLMHNAEKLSLMGCFSHIIMDEAHRAGAPEWHSRGLHNAIGKDTKIVGLSATMQRYSDGIDVKEFLNNNCAGRLSLFQAMAMGILPVGKYVYSVLDMKSKVEALNEEIENKYSKSLKEKNHLLDQLNTKEIKDYSIQNIISKYYQDCEYRKIIVFCENIDHVSDIGSLLEKTFPKFSKTRIYKVHSGETKKDNNVQFERFSHAKPKGKEIHILIAVDMLNEGIDVLGIDSIMLFRRTESPRIYFQQIGRSIRKHGVETPLIFDCVLNFQNVNVNFIKESKKEFSNYRNKLEKFGFEDIDVPKTMHVHDEMQSISNIIDEVEKRLNCYPTYEEAKDAVMKLGITSYKEYGSQYADDPRLPSSPSLIYQGKGWMDWYNFFGKEAPDFYETYEEAKEAVMKLGITSYKEYGSRYKEDPKLPRNASGVYQGKGWTDWYDLLGRETPDFYETYEEAKDAVMKLGIRVKEEYGSRYKEDPKLPSSPNTAYQGKGWIGFPIFLGQKTLEYSTYEEAKNAVMKLGITSMSEYRKRSKEDTKLTSTPEKFYKGKGWSNFYKFFGKETPDFYETYEEAKNAVMKLGISSRPEYRKRYKDDPRLPSQPHEFYKEKGWIGLPNFFGRETPDFYHTYEEAKEAVMKLGISSYKEYHKRYKKDPRLPCKPNEIYQGKGWTDWYDLLGRETPDFYETYEEAKNAVVKLGINSKSEYRTRYKENPKLPSNPQRIYKNKGWIESAYFFGKTKK